MASLKRPPLGLHETDQVEAGDVEGVTYIRDAWLGEIPAQSLLRDDDPVMETRKSDNEWVRAVAATPDAEELPMLGQNLACLQLDVSAEWHEETQLGHRPAVNVVLALLELVLDDVNGPDAAQLDEDLDVGPQAVERGRWEQIAAAVQQRACVEGVVDHHYTTARRAAVAANRSI